MHQRVQSLQAVMCIKEFSHSVEQSVLCRASKSSVIQAVMCIKEFSR